MTYFGFDHHKRWTQAVAIDENGKILREGRLSNDTKSLQQFLLDLPKPWKGVIEAGPTWGWIYDTLSSLGVEMVIANPMQVRAIAEAKIKNDSIDARMLAQLLRGDLIPAIYVPKEDIRGQKMLWRERVHLVRMQTRLKNRIHRLLTHYHVTIPELNDIFGSTCRKFLSQVQLPHPGNKILSSEIKLLENYRAQIKEVQCWAEEATKNHPYRSYLESLPGFGKTFAPIAALEIDSLERFSEPGKLASYSGLVPSLYSSGGKSWQGGVGKRGNHWLKWVFVEAAWTAVRCSPSFRLQYQRLRQRKIPQVAILACARRLCTIAYHVIKERRNYEERSLTYA
jgi:transposase